MRSLAALLTTGAAGVILASYHWQSLPERVASHFNLSGTPDAWMSRDANFFFSAGMMVFVTASFSLVGVLVRRLPARWINLPNKPHWFAPERERETRDDLERWSYSFGALLNLFMIFVTHLAYLANRSEPVELDSVAMLIGLVVFLVASLGGVVALLVRFKKAPDTRSCS